MTTRELISDDGRVRRYRVLDAGVQIGTDEEIIPTPEQVNAATLRGRLLQSIAANVAYIALTTPTAAQTTAQTRRNAQQNTALIRLALEQLDTTDGT
ncbi:MAG: hypothetical protein M3R09_07670 [Actinomycetota bacterium]|nr:hypothetical protein [Actinomycetota bacterium]